MRNLKEKVAYLHGLTQGLNVNEHSSEGKVLLNIIDVLDSFADEVRNVNLAQRELEDYVESIDEDLTDLEEEVYEKILTMKMMMITTMRCMKTSLKTIWLKWLARIVMNWLLLNPRY